MTAATPSDRRLRARWADELGQRYSGGVKELAFVALAQAPDQEPQDLPAADLTQASPETRVVSKCVVDGRVSYSSLGACSGRSVAVPVRSSNSALEGGFSPYELQMLQSADARIERNEAAAAVATTGQYSGIKTLRSECAALEQQIASLDAYARSAISAHEQDRIRNERAQLRSREFALRC